MTAKILPFQSRQALEREEFLALSKIIAGDKVFVDTNEQFDNQKLFWQSLNILPDKVSA